MERLTKVSAVGEHLPRKPLNLIHKSDSSESNLTEILEKLGKYEDAEEQGLFLGLPCKVGDTVYVDSAILPIKDMECENIDHKIPLYFPARIVSFRFAKRNWMKIAFKAK